MFTEITGNNDLYRQDVGSCIIYCRQSCRSGCDGELPVFTFLADDFYIISGEEVTTQN